MRLSFGVPVSFLRGVVMLICSCALGCECLYTVTSVSEDRVPAGQFFFYLLRSGFRFQLSWYNMACEHLLLWIIIHTFFSILLKILILIVYTCL